MSETQTVPGQESNSQTQTPAGVENQIPGDAAGQAETDEGFEIVLAGDEKGQRQDSATNRKFAARRLARKRQLELEAQLQAVNRGELPEDVRVKPELPAAPDVNSFLSDEALASKYDYDTNKALAAFNAATSEWQIKAMDARSDAVVKQGHKVQEFTDASKNWAGAAKTHYDAAEKLGLDDYEEKEDAARAALPKGWDVQIMELFPEKSAALLYHLGANPGKISTLLSFKGPKQTIYLANLARDLEIKPRGKTISQAPEPDSGIQAAANAGNRAALEKAMNDAASKGDVATYRKIKLSLKGMK